MKEVTDRELIFWLSEAEMLAAYINDYAMVGAYVEMRKVVDDFRKSVVTYKEVLDGYSKSKVVNPKILKKGRDFSEYADIVLDKCHTFLRQHFQILEGQDPSEVSSSLRQ